MVKKIKEEPKKVTIFHRHEWRDWLAKNHDREHKVAMISHKKHTGKPSLNHREAMEEAICFGWIDTTAKRIDEDTWIRHFSRRTDKSRWSKNTIKCGRDLIKRKLMTSAGLIRFKEGLKKPLLDDFNGVDDNVIPGDLKNALEKEKLIEKFEKLSNSYRRMYIRQMLRAKRPETKQKRIEMVIKSLK